MPSNIEKLIGQLAQAKHEESLAKAKRLQAEEAIIAELKEELPEKGSKTITGDGCKLTINTGISYKADVDAISLIDSDFILLKREFNDKAYEKARESDPVLFGRISEHVTVAPKKPTLSIKIG